MAVITEAFKTAGAIRARTLGMPGHPRVVVEHPMASKTESEVQDMVERHLDEIVEGLIKQ